MANVLGKRTHNQMIDETSKDPMTIVDQCVSIKKKLDEVFDLVSIITCTCYDCTSDNAYEMLHEEFPKEFWDKYGHGNCDALSNGYDEMLDICKEYEQYKPGLTQMWVDFHKYSDAESKILYDILKTFGGYIVEEFVEFDTFNFHDYYKGHTFYLYDSLRDNILIALGEKETE